MPRDRRFRVLIVTSQDSGGGAPRAIFRIFRAMQEPWQDDTDVYLRVVHKSHEDDHIIGGKPSRDIREFVAYFLRTRFRKFFPRRPFISDNRLLHSQALYSSGLGKEINRIRPDVVLLGWLGNSTLSIREIGRLQAPVVWRLSDMWVFCGAEHYTDEARYASGYSRVSRPKSESGPDINRETFKRKLRLWKNRPYVISPSGWMTGELKKSHLTRRWPVETIPNAIDTDYWKPVSQGMARNELGLPSVGKIILFGAGAGLKDEHKGGDLLLKAIQHLSTGYRVGDYAPRVVIFGEFQPSFQIGDIPVMFLGRLDDNGLRMAYSAANVMAVPSRLDNFPSTAAEAQACAVPVVAFRTAGLPDVVKDGQTGILSSPFDCRELADSMHRILANRSLENRLGQAARARAEVEWAPAVVAQAYLQVLQKAAGKKAMQPNSQYDDGPDG